MHGHPLKENDLVIESVDIQQRKKSLLDFEGYNFLSKHLIHVCTRVKEIKFIHNNYERLKMKGYLFKIK